MGTFFGHVFAGVMFVTLGILWSLVAWDRFYQSRSNSSRNKCRGRRRPKSSAQNHLSASLFCWPGLPFDGIFKLVAAILGVITETVPIPLYNLPWISHTFHHVAMYSFFGLSGAVDLLVSAGVKLPSNTEYVALALAFAVEALLFYYHVFGRPPLNVQLHMLLLLVAVVIAIIVLIEMIFKEQHLPTLLRSIAMMVQGTWLVHIGFLLYNPIKGYVPWNQFDVEAVMMATVYFTLHIAGAILFAILSGLFMYSLNKKKLKTSALNSSYAPLLTNTQDNASSKNDKVIANGEMSNSKVTLDSE